ncbi:stress response translation initiation inhibitor YciH [Halobium salinum]|uniref:Stress response translation initiation inhibitor YciH n=1 Tax=Halobium salinum TaxID=1364940 RepID=A0ABD5P9X7_9EURY
MADDFSKVTGLPDDLGIEDDLRRSEEVLTVRTDTRRYGKAMTIIEGFEDGEDLRELASSLKRSLACGGTVEGDTIELQGNHVARVPDLLREHGYAVEER